LTSPACDAAGASTRQAATNAVSASHRQSVRIKLINPTLYILLRQLGLRRLPVRYDIATSKMVLTATT
jgi:hypothetical protein